MINNLSFEKMKICSEFLKYFPEILIFNSDIIILITH